MKHVISILFVFGFTIFAIPVQGANEYLNSYSNHCTRGSIEPYFDYSLRDADRSIGTYQSNNGEIVPFTYPDGRNQSDEWRGGVRFRFDLGSTCNKKFKKMMNEANDLRIELELLKLCGRYKNLTLGDNFKTVREKCKDIMPNITLDSTDGN